VLEFRHRQQISEQSAREADAARTDKSYFERHLISLLCSPRYIRCLTLLYQGTDRKRYQIHDFFASELSTILTFVRREALRIDRSPVLRRRHPRVTLEQRVQVLSAADADIIGDLEDGDIRLP